MRKIWWIIPVVMSLFLFSFGSRYLFITHIVAVEREEALLKISENNFDKICFQYPYNGVKLLFGDKSKRFDYYLSDNKIGIVVGEIDYINYVITLPLSINNLIDARCYDRLSIENESISKIIERHIVLLNVLK